MQVSIEATSGLEKRMTVEVPAEKIETEIKKRLKSMQPNVKLQGFRPGKVPMSVVEKRYAGKIRQEVTGEVVNSTFFEAVNNEDLKPAGMPKIESQTHDNDAGLKYTAVFEVYPEFKISGVENCKITRPVADITDSDIDAMIDKLRKQRSEWREVQRPAEESDRVNADYKGTIDGESFAGGEGEDLEIVIGSGSMIEGFESGLVGAKVGDTVEMDLKFPDDYQSKEVAGKDVHFSVAINAVEESELPEINEEFLKTFGVTDGSVDTFRDELKSNMQRELEKNIKAKIKSDVMDALLVENTFDIPNTMIDAESERVAQQMNEQMKMNQGNQVPNGMQPFEAGQFKEQGRRRVALGLILSEVIKDNDLKAPADKVRAEIESIAGTYHDPKEVIAWYYQDKNRLQEIESMVLEDQVVDWVLDHAQVTDNMTTFDEIMRDSR